MSRFNLRQKPRISYYEPEEPNLDEYIFCDKCCDYVFAYCSIHGGLLVVPDDKVPAKTGFPPIVPRAALTIPHVFLHLARSIIPGAGIGVFSTLTLPRGVRFGPYGGARVLDATSDYCWQIFDRNNKAAHVVDAADSNKSNWMRYVNCARHWHEQNLVAFQYKGQLYYRTIKIIPRFTELMVFYGAEFAHRLRVDLAKYNSPAGYAHKFGVPVPKKCKQETRKEKPIQESIRAEDTTERAKVKNVTNVTVDAVNTDQTKNQAANIAAKNNLMISAGRFKMNVFHKPDKIQKADPLDKTRDPNSQINRKKNKAKNTRIAKDKCNETLKISQSKAKVFKIPIKSEKSKALNVEKSGADLKSEVETEKKNDNNNNIASEKHFICNDCNELFNTRTLIVQHIKTHDLLPCDICDYKTAILDNLERHLQIHAGKKLALAESDSTCFSCPECSNTFTQKGDLKQHMLIHSGIKPFSCPECSNKFNDKSNLKQHMLIHSGLKPFSCPECSNKFTQKGHLKQHMLIHSGLKPFSCPECSNKFTHKGHLKQHMLIHSGLKPFSCPECSNKFTHKGHLKQHMLIHSGLKPFSCPECSNKFTQKGSLKLHMLVHSGLKPFSCPECSNKFTHKGSLKLHMLVHSGLKPFSCPECSNKFTQKGSLKLHMLIHSGLKPFSCPECSNKFTRKGSLKLHMLVHSGLKPFSCPECSNKFTRKGSLKRHMLVHSGLKPFSCPECSNKFTRKGSLKLHMLVHSGLKPFSCPECSNKFTQKNDLKRHMLIHSGIKPFSCPECSNKFTHKGSLNRHMLAHSGFSKKT